MNELTLNEIFKTCSKCNEVKESTEFYTKKKSHCKDCTRSYNAQYRMRMGADVAIGSISSNCTPSRTSQLKHKPFIGNAVSENCLVATPFENDLNCAVILFIETKKEIGTRNLYVATRLVDVHRLSISLLSVLFQFKAFSKAEKECFFVTDSHEYAAYCRIVWGQVLQLETVLDHVREYVNSKDCPKPCPLRY